MIPEINSATKMTLEITLKEKTYDCVLRGFFLDGEDLRLHTDMHLDEEIASAPDEIILTELWEENRFFWAKAFASDSKKAMNEDQKELFAFLSETLENLDYAKLKKTISR